MELKIQKSRLVILFLLGFLLCVFVASIFYIQKLENRGEIGYFNEVLEFCDSKEVDENEFFTCKTLLVDEWVEKGERCFEMLIYISSMEKLRPTKFCAPSKLVFWENPYEDYQKMIPLEVSFLFNQGLLEEFKLSLVDEESLQMILHHPETEVNDIRIPRREEELEKGYFLGATINGEKNLLLLIDVLVYSVDVRNEELIISFFTNINGEKADLTVKSEGFYYSEKTHLDEDSSQDYDETEEFQFVDPANYERDLFQQHLSLLFFFQGDLVEMENYIESLSSSASEGVPLSEDLELVLVESSTVYEDIY